MVVAISGRWKKLDGKSTLSGAVYLDGRISRFQGSYLELVHFLGKQAGGTTIVTADAVLAHALVHAGYKAELMRREPGLRQALRAYLAATYRKKLPLVAEGDRVA